MADAHVAASGRIYCASIGDTILNTSKFQIADFRGGYSADIDTSIADWFGQATVRQAATVTVKNPVFTIDEVAFEPDNLAKLHGIDTVEMAARKRVTAITQGATEATLTCEPGCIASFEDNEQVVVADETGWKKEGYIDGAPPATTTVKVDNGAGAAVADIEKVGIHANIDSSEPQYFTRADNVLLDIGDGQDYSCTIWFKRDRDTATEVLMAKTSDYDGTAYVTTAGWVLFIGVDDKLYFAVNDGVDAYVLNGKTAITDGKWHHVLATFDESDASNCRIYLDGYNNTLSRTGTLTSIGDCSNGLAFSIGAESDGGYPFDGCVRDAAVWDNVVVSAADALANACAPITEPGTPTAWWPFYDAAAATAIDDGATAANALDLTLVGGTTTNFGTHSRTQFAYVTANLLGSDWGMENGGIGGWPRGDAATHHWKDEQYVKYSKQSFAIKNTDTTQAFVRQTITTIANVDYYFHGWFRAPVTPNGASQLVDVDAAAGKGATVTQAGATTGGTWYEVEFAFEAGDTSTTIDLGSGSVTDAQIGYWENVQIFKNYIDEPGFEATIALSGWVQIGTPTVDDQDTAERSGTYCYEINGDADNYVKQDVTITSGEVYTFIGHVKCGSADLGVIDLSGAATATLDNDSETTDWVEVKKTFTAATTTLTIKIYGNGAAAWFDDFAVIKVDFKEYHYDENLSIPEKQYMLQYTDDDDKKNQLYFGNAIALGIPIAFTNLDYVTHGMNLLPIEDSNGDIFVFLVEN